MANKRMFARSVIDNDRFLDLPLQSQALYFHLGLQADDEGFVASPNKVIKSIGAKPADIEKLIDSGYAYKFESGVVVITDWKIHNTIQADRFNETIHKEEREQLSVDNSKRYVFPKCIQNGNTIRLDKISIDKTNSMSANNRAEREKLFDTLWGLYPEKKGRQEVTDKDKRKLTDIGLDQCKRAIDRYIKEVEHSGFLHYKHGSTFFHSGIYDYLDESYTPSQERQLEKVQRKNKAENEGCCNHQTELTEEQIKDALQADEERKKEERQQATEPGTGSPFKNGASAEYKKLKAERRLKKNE